MGNFNLLIILQQKFVECLVVPSVSEIAGPAKLFLGGNALAP